MINPFTFKARNKMPGLNLEDFGLKALEGDVIDISLLQNEAAKLRQLLISPLPPEQFTAVNTELKAIELALDICTKYKLGKKTSNPLSNLFDSLSSKNKSKK